MGTLVFAVKAKTSKLWSGQILMAAEFGCSLPSLVKISRAVPLGRRANTVE